MGWGWKTRPTSLESEVAEHLEAHAKTGTVLGHHLAGLDAPGGERCLWIAFAPSSPRSGEQERMIVYVLLKSQGGCWGESAGCETMGPYRWDCPLAFLDLVPVPRDEYGFPYRYAQSWRDGVRQFHAEKAAAKESKKQAKALRNAPGGLVLASA